MLFRGKEKLACVASVSVWFRSKQGGTRVKDRAKNCASERAGRGWLSFHFSRCEIRKCPSSVFLCSETKEKLKDRFARTAALMWNGLPKSLKSLRKSQFNPLNPNIKIQILICYPYTFSIEVVSVVGRLIRLDSIRLDSIRFI